MCVYVAKRGEGGTQYWYSVKTDTWCFVCQVLARLFCFESHSERIGADGREILFVLFLDIPIESLRLLSFYPLPPLVYVFLSSFLSLSFLRTFFFLKKA